ncbi:MAG: hypothetical protein AAFX53_01275 [Bacteroidota bacterium]
MMSLIAIGHAGINLDFEGCTTKGTDALETFNVTPESAKGYMIKPLASCGVKPT